MLVIGSVVREVAETMGNVKAAEEFLRQDQRNKCVQQKGEQKQIFAVPIQIAEQMAEYAALPEEEIYAVMEIVQQNRTVIVMREGPAGYPAAETQLPITQVIQ